jgi:D-alanyl-D-alanine carboxypeptidase (penicillin-binding protein 5/6)
VLTCSTAPSDVVRDLQPRHARRYRAMLLASAAIGLVLGGALIAAAAVPLPSDAPSLLLQLTLSRTAGPSPRVPFPSQGESAVAIPSLGYRAATVDQQPRPIASLTKLMTAYVTLQRLPLRTGASGPSIQVGSADVRIYRDDVRTGQTNVKVADGEVLTERQLLEGLLVPSANNFAVLLAEMVAGSESEMTADMNAAASTLGLHSTTYADVSGFDPATQSSAIDQLRLAELLMRDQTFASIVRLPEVWLPVAGDVVSFTPDIGQPHVVGVKSGYTSQAGGCDVMAYDARVGRHEVQVLVVVLGQFSLTPDRTNVMAAGRDAYVLAAATAGHLRPWKITLARHVVGAIGWGSNAVPVLATATIIVPVFSGIGSRVRVDELPWATSHVPAGRVLATVFVTSGAYREIANLVAGGALKRASLWQRLH